MNKLYYIGSDYFSDLIYGKGYELSEVLRISMKYSILYRIQIDIRNTFISELEIRKLKLLKIVK